MVIKQLYNDNLWKLRNEYGDISVMCVATEDSDQPGYPPSLISLYCVFMFSQVDCEVLKVPF